MTENLSLEGTVGRTSQLLREKEEKRAQEHRRHALYLIADFLATNGYFRSLETLEKEAHLTTDFELCDNIELESILLQYKDDYYAKFNKYPKIYKKVDNPEAAGVINNALYKKDCTKIHVKNAKKFDKWNNLKSKEECNSEKNNSLQDTTNNSSADKVNFEMMITPIFPNESSDADLIKTSQRKLMDGPKISKIINSLYPSDSEWHEIANQISKEIVLKDLKTHWDDVKGLDKVKSELRANIVYPIKYPTLFPDKFSPAKGILLYGPPGTGKTMLAKAVATECQCTFFNITSSSIISKWRGESEKYIRILLDIAYHCAPSVIFIDEIDWIATKNEYQSSSYSEPARRFRSELLIRMDGLLNDQNSNVTILAATNVPWNIDEPLLRRLELRLFVDLPADNIRYEILQLYVDVKLYGVKEFQEYVNTDLNEYSCAEIILISKRAWMLQMQNHWQDLEKRRINVNDIKEDFIKELSILKTATALVPKVKNNIDKYVEWTEPQQKAVPKRM